MKRIAIILMSTMLCAACNNTGEGGAVDDGIRPLDSNGALRNAPRETFNPSTDSTVGDDRVDTEKRDSAQNDTLRR